MPKLDIFDHLHKAWTLDINIAMVVSLILILILNLIFILILILNLIFILILFLDLIFILILILDSGPPEPYSHPDAGGENCH